MKSIKIVFAKDGTSKMEAFGFKGKACLAATKEIEDAIGKVDSRKAKPEQAMVDTTASLKQES